MVEGGNVLRLCDRLKKGQEKADWPTKEGTPTNCGETKQLLLTSIYQSATFSVVGRG